MANIQLSQVQANKFMLVSDQFGYNIYAAYVPSEPNCDITDNLFEAAKFESKLNDAEAMAKRMSYEFGYKFKAVPCAS